MTNEEEIENAARALWNRDRAELGMTPIPWDEAGDYQRATYRAAVSA